MFNLQFPPVRRLVLNEGAARVARDVEDSKADELWQGDAVDPANPQDPTVPVYLRLGQRAALVAELVCGCVARALCLPAPEVFLLTVPAGHLAGSALARPDAPTLCVATRDIGGATFAQFLSSNEDAALQLLHQWPELARVVAFDEWLANQDRNLGNIIYVAQTLHIIDHADAFGGSARQLFPLAELTTQQFQNKLAGTLNAYKSSKRNELLQDVHTWLAQVGAGINIPAVVESASTRPWNTPEQDGELVDFIQQRLTLTHALLCNRLGHPQLSLTALAPARTAGSAVGAQLKTLRPNPRPASAFAPAWWCARKTVRSAPNAPWTHARPNTRLTTPAWPCTKWPGTCANRWRSTGQPSLTPTPGHRPSGARGWPA